MIRYKIIYIYLLYLIYYATSEESTKEADDRTLSVLKPPDKLILQKSQPYPERKDESSFMSNLASWVFPFGESEKTNDLIPAAGHHGGPQYLPAPSFGHSHIKKDCNPCNEEPWVPIASNLGQQTVLSFVPPSVNFNNDFSSHSTDLTGLETLLPPPASYKTPEKQYGVPLQFRPKIPKPNYGLPKPLGSSHGHPLDDPVLPLNIYGPPPNKGDIVVVDYMVPPPLNYKIPSLLYGPPRGSHIPLNPIYGPPAKPIYGLPPKPVYGPPPKQNYGPPPNPIYVPPLQSYPEESNHPEQYGPPPSLSFQPPPPLLNQYGAPQNNPSTYLRPVHENYAPPRVNNNYGPPPLNYIPTNPTTFVEGNTNGNIPPAVPSDSYGAPVTGDNLDYLAPSEQLSLPSGHNANLERPIPLPNLSSAPVAPIHDFGDFNQGFDTQHSLQESNHENNNVQIQQSLNVADYLASIEHPINVIQSPLIEVSVKDENIDLQQEISNNDNGYSEFTGNYGGNEQKSFRDANDNLNIDTNDSNERSGDRDLLNSQTYNEQNLFNQVEEKTYNSINDKLHDSDNINHYATPSIKLSENPIIVEDVHTAASNINNTFVKSKERQVKRTNDKHLSISTFINEHQSPSRFPKNMSVSANLIKELLLYQESLGHLHRDVNNQISNNKTSFTTPLLEYGNWEPTYDRSISTSIVPPPLTGSNIFMPANYSITTKKPNQLQIIIPYITSKKPGWFEKDLSPKNQMGEIPTKITGYNNAYTTLLPVYTPPSSTQVSMWSKFVDDFNLAESKRITATAFSKPVTAVYNIKDLLQTEYGNYHAEKLPYDIVSLQKNIDDWTQQAYSSKAKLAGDKKSTVKALSSKKIPDDYLTTQIYSSNDITTIRNDLLDSQSEGSAKKEIIVKNETDDIETNLIIAAETTTEEATTAAPSVSSTKSPFPSPFSPKGQRSLWDVSHVTVSPHTREKVYVVTPQAYNFYTSTPATAWSMSPKIQNGRVNNASTYDTYKFSIRVEPQSKNSREKLKKELNGPVKVVFSEWPHLINNLQTTTTKPTSRHPLFGLMDIPVYTPSPNSTVETIVGHSRVTTVVTPASVPRKKVTGSTDKKTTIKVTTSKSF